jgi:4-diphosphocytidyl-2-C-methyl-D-erythritol kinase
MAEALRIEAPAKINLHLAVGKRREDGFHEIESIFLALGWGDTLCFEPLPLGRDFEVRYQGPAPAPPEHDLVLRAARLFRERAGCGAYSIAVRKRIPVGAGLGGGSSDAAAVLRGLSALSGRGRLRDMALELGSDVPFFLEPGAAFVRGRGERIEALSLAERLWVVLVYPGFGSSTSEAFAMLDAAGACRGDFPAAAIGRPETWCNDFLPVLLRSAHADAYSAMLEELRSLGASFAGLSGTGSACFGIFTKREEAFKAESALLAHWTFVQLTFSLRF